MNKKDTYRAFVNNTLIYTTAINKERALLNIRKKSLKKFGSFNITDLHRKIKETNNWTRVPF